MTPKELIEILKKANRQELAEMARLLGIHGHFEFRTARQRLAERSIEDQPPPAPVPPGRISPVDPQIKLKRESYGPLYPSV
jgi:hypothetical protein